MSLSIIHLSDLHIKENDLYLLERTDLIVDAIKSNIDLDVVLLLVSGDVAFSGKEKEYAIAKQFFDSLISKIQKHAKDIRFLVVPGNHDIDFCGQPRSRGEILKIRKNGYLKTDIENETNKFHNFWNFVNNYPMNMFNTSKLVDVKNFVLGDNQISVNLINSAVFSLYKDELADSDKDLHYIPIAELQKMEHQPSSLNICLMHHSIDCFCEETRSKLCAILDQKADLVFTGHNHYISTKQTLISPLDSTLYFQGGKLNDSSEIESSFDVITYNEIDGECIINNFYWNNSYHLYDFSLGGASKLCNYDVTKKFQSWLNSSDVGVMTCPYKEYFVFPRLKIKKENDFDSNRDKDILSFEDFYHLVKNKRIVEISGEDLAGKTTLLKYLYEQYGKQYRPFIITSDDITVSIDKTIKNAFDNQYGENNAAFQKFLQLPSSNKIAFIDDIEAIAEKGRNGLLQKLLERFDKVIYTTNKIHDLDINKLILEAIENASETFMRMKIEPLYADKRNELILNVCSCLNEQGSKEEIEEVAAKVNTFIKNQIKLFPLNPTFIIMFTRCYVSNYVDRSNTNAFNEVFSGNISAAIEKARKKTTLNDDLIILQEVASFVHFNKRYPISNKDFISIVDAYNQKHRATCNGIDVINELLDAKILKLADGGITFVNKSYLAFFVAKWLNRQIHNGKGKDELKNIVDNVCFNINADILLFLTYITENVAALYVILNEAKDFSNAIDEYDFDCEPMSILTDWSKPQTLSLVTEKDRKQIKENEVDRERHIKENERIEKANIYEENIDEIVAIQTKLLKYLELIAKILPNFSHLLDADQQDEFVEEIYKLPNRIIEFLFMPFEINKEQMVAEFEQVVKEKHLEEQFKSPDDIKYFISNLLNAMMLTIYDITAENAVTERTIKALDCFNYEEKTTYFIQNIMMHEQLKGFSQYVQRSDALFDKTKSIYIKHLLRLIFRKHCFYHEVKYLRDGQKYIDKYLPQTQGKDIKLIAHKIKKKKDGDKE